ncbi:hypothetical protein [Arthrobacter sp. CAN_C5]|uniref:hypothetical protein n=1 Tax=Arthrobacter sp. CAN_C5 TaxID=2760706 RepID=UPI001AE7C356|nr:hypothetical protein [Arthrobacter sp. CAN_C5]MBP2215990.1 hypothetical protein [Arthrobacter sp. CAN_C5]
MDEETAILVGDGGADVVPGQVNLGQPLPSAVWPRRRHDAELMLKKITDLNPLYEAYGEYFVDGEARWNHKEAREIFDVTVPDLSDERRDHHAKLIGFAVHTEMKHWDDSGYLLSKDHEYEVLVDMGNYYSEDDVLERGSEDNRREWADLANLAAQEAYWENIEARNAAKKAA